jgi:thiol-disulfide isomerase/thioredoxin
MKILTFLFLFAAVAQAQTGTGIQFFEGSWADAVAKAKKEHKLIFVDAYAVWCGPCQRMAKEVFTLPEVGTFYNKNFINVKFDMEKGEGSKFAQKYQVSSYPTLLFIDETETVVNVAKGSRPADQFVALGKATLNRLDKTTDFEEKYEAGERSAEFLRAYAYQLLMSGSPTLKIANEYLRSQKDLQTAANLEFLFDFCSECDSRLFDMVLQNKAAFVKEQGQAVFDKKIEAACNATVQKAVELDNADLLDEAKKQMKKANPSYAKEYAYIADIQYYFAKSDLPKLIEATDNYVKKFAKKDAKKLNQQAAFFSQFIQDPTALSKAETWAKKAVELEPIYEHWDTYVHILKLNGKAIEADQANKEMQKLKKELPKPLIKN